MCDVLALREEEEEVLVKSGLTADAPGAKLAAQVATARSWADLNSIANGIGLKSREMGYDVPRYISIIHIPFASSVPLLIEPRRKSQFSF